MNANQVVRYSLPASEKAHWVKILHDSRAGAKLVADCKKHGFPEYPADKIADRYVNALQEVGYKFEIVPDLKMD
jgi:hypothetical protein